MFSTGLLRCARTLAALLLVAWLAGCAAPAPVPPSERLAAAEAHQRWLQGLSQWRASGRVAVDIPGEAWNATLQWRQEASSYLIQLSGPFGQGAVRIDGDADSVQLRTAQGQVTSAASAEALVARELGAQMPITALRYWLTGRPAPDQPVTRQELDNAGQLLELDQAGWQVRYLEYLPSDGGALPARLSVRREDWQARFLISRWQLGG